MLMQVQVRKAMIRSELRHTCNAQDVRLPAERTMHWMLVGR